MLTKVETRDKIRAVGCLLFKMESLTLGHREGDPEPLGGVYDHLRIGLDGGGHVEFHLVAWSVFPGKPPLFGLSRLLGWLVCYRPV